MARQYTCRTVRAVWKGAYCDVEVHIGERNEPIELRVPALMPEPLKFHKAEADALANAIKAAIVEYEDA